MLIMKTIMTFHPGIYAGDLTLIGAHQEQPMSGT